MYDLFTKRVANKTILIEINLNDTTFLRFQTHFVQNEGKSGPPALHNV